MTSTMFATDRYWMTLNAKDIACKMGEFHGDWSMWANNPISNAWIRNTFAYYSTLVEANWWDSSLRFTGEQGELVKMVVPQARSLSRQMVSITTKQKLNFNALAYNPDGDVVNSIRIGNALGQNIVDDQTLNETGRLICERAIVLGTSYIMSTWRTDRGKPWAVDENGKLVYTGNLEMYSPAIDDVFFDASIMSWKDLDWVEVRRKMNRWDLIQQFPDMRNDILNLPGINDWRTSGTEFRSISEDDLIWVYELYHRPTPALPNGRMMFYGNEKTVFADDDNVYGKIPIQQMKPEPIEGTGFGYPYLSNLLPAQEMLDHCFSAIATNQSAFAVQNIVYPRDESLSSQDINGMNFISYTPMPGVPGGGKPEPLNLTQTPSEVFKFADMLLAHMQQISNISGALRGSPPPGANSGKAIATLTANALEFMDAFSIAYTETMERAMNDAINAYRIFATVEQMIELVGIGNKTKVVTFKGSDLEPVRKMTLTRSNPMMQTIGGRVELADKLVASNMIKNVQGYVGILEGDPLNTLYQAELSEEDLINAENDALLEGATATEVPILWTDDHAKHFREVMSLLNDPKVRSNSEMVANIIEHATGHQNHALEIATNPQNQYIYAMMRTGVTPSMPPPPPNPGALPGGGAPMGGQPPGNELEGGQPGMSTGTPEESAATPAQDMLGRPA